MAADPLTDPQTARLDRRVTWSVIALTAATVLVGALVPGAPRHAALAPAQNLAPAQDPACAEWGDGCKVCRRTEDGAACSLPGIACTPGAMACLRAAGEP